MQENPILTVGPLKADFQEEPLSRQMDNASPRPPWGETITC